MKVSDLAMWSIFAALLAAMLWIFVWATGAANTPGTITYQKANDSRWKIEIIDGCEYVVTGWGGGEGLTHKGNCFSCLARQGWTKQAEKGGGP